MTSFTAKAALSQSGAPLQTYFIANEPSLRSSLSSRALSSAFLACSLLPDRLHKWALPNFHVPRYQREAFSPRSGRDQTVGRIGREVIWKLGGENSNGRCEILDDNTARLNKFRDPCVRSAARREPAEGDQHGDLPQGYGSDPDAAC